MSKVIGIMQPYFLPYIGYFQLMNMVDEFVVYDAIEYSKKGWINRNRMLCNGKSGYFTIPLKKDSDYLNINERYISQEFCTISKKILRKIESNYKKAPNFDIFFPVVEKIFSFQNQNLFNFILNSIILIKEYLEIETPLVISSSLPSYIEDLKGGEKVLAICQELKATRYINPPGGVNLYHREKFEENGIELIFFRTKKFEYTQLGGSFVPFLSILDVCMFNSTEFAISFLSEYEVFS